MSSSSIERAQARAEAAQAKKAKSDAPVNPGEKDVSTPSPTQGAANKPEVAGGTPGGVLSLSVSGLPDVATCSDAVQREISEEFRALKRAILGSTYGEDSASPDNLIMITSISPKAGKSFTSLQLGRSLSLEPNKHALLVDADVFQSTLSKQFTPSPEKGLSDFLLSDRVDVSDIIYKTDVERLRLLPMGESDSMMNELLNSDRMSALLTEFKSRYRDRLVIFDAPPLLRSNVAMTLAEKMDQIIILIEPGVTETADLKSVQEHLPSDVDVKYVISKSMDPTNWTKEKQN